MFVKYATVAITSDTSGNGSGTTFINGRLLAIHMKNPGAGTVMDTGGVDITVTGGITGVAILAVTNATVTTSGTNSYHPRVKAHLNSSGAAMVYAGTDAVPEPIALAEEITISVAQAGNTKSATFYVVYE